MPLSPRQTRWLQRISIGAGWIRDAWLIVGLTLALCLAAEALYRVQAFVRRTGPAPQTVATDEQAAWLPAYLQEHKRATEAQRWRPYVYLRTEQFAGHFINVDASGLRRTVQPDVPGAPEVFILGGSTMFGTFQRDEWTIPSVAARQFAVCGVTAQFRNLGQSGRVFTQEVIDLIVRLRDGARPRVVIFYDGINDVMALIQNGRPGWPQNERNRARDFTLGNRAYWWEKDLRSDAVAASHLLLAGVNRSQLLQRIVGPISFPMPPLVDVAPHHGTDVDSLVLSYAATMRVVEALSREFNFTPVYVWQPTIHTTRKRLSNAEARIITELEGESVGRRALALHRGVARAIDTPAQQVAGDRFLNLSTVFDQESRPVFADSIGHTYEHANDTLAKALLPRVARILGVTSTMDRCS